MPLIKTIPPKEATGELAELYDKAISIRGQVSPSQMLFSTSPTILKHQIDFVDYYITHPTLSQELLACIRMLVSETTDCAYCIGFNASMLINRLGWTEEEVTAAKQDPDNAKLDEREKAMLRFVLKGIKDAHAITKEDLDSLRDLGFSDGEILDALNHGARMVATDIIMNAFKLEAKF